MARVHGCEAPRSWLLASFVAWLVALGLGVGAFAVAGPGSLIASVPLFLLLAVGCLAVNLAGRLRTLAAAAPAALSGNLHGVCSGATTPEGSGDLALTDWLHETLQVLAGRQTTDVPVTYADLADADVELVTITTDVSHGSYEPFPLRTSGWAFRRADMRHLFPAAVVEHLVARAAAR